MANTTTAGTIFIDTANSTAYTGRVKVAYILLSSEGSHAEVLIHDGTSSSAPVKLSLKVSSSHTTQQFDFSASPLIFQTGIYVNGLSTNCELMFITTTKGSVE